MVETAFVEEIRKMVATTEARAVRVEDLRAQRDALQSDATAARSKARALLARRETAVVEHEDLVAVLQEVYAVLQEEENTADRQNHSLVHELGTSFQALERSSSRLREQRTSLRRARKSILLQVDETAEASDDDENGHGSASNWDSGRSHHGTGQRSPLRSDMRLPVHASPLQSRSRTAQTARSPSRSPARGRQGTAARAIQQAYDEEEDAPPTPDAVDGSPSCPYSPAPLRMPTVYDLPTVPFDLSDNEDEGSEDDEAGPGAGGSGSGVVTAAAAAAAVASTSLLQGRDASAELSMLEDGPEARPVQLKHLTTEQVEEVYRQRDASRPRKHDLTRHKCPGRRRYCDQCGERMARGKEHNRCSQCAAHFCDSCEKGGVSVRRSYGVGVGGPD